MPVKKTWALLAVLLLTTGFLLASPQPHSRLLIYIYGQPFEARHKIQGQQIYVEEQPALEAFNLPSTFAVPKNLELSLNGKTFVLLKGLADLTHTAYQVNWLTRIVDVYSVVFLPYGEGNNTAPVEPSTTAPSTTSPSSSAPASPSATPYVPATPEGMPMNVITNPLYLGYGYIPYYYPYYPYIPPYPTAVLPAFPSPPSPSRQCMIFGSVCDFTTMRPFR